MQQQSMEDDSLVLSRIGTSGAVNIEINNGSSPSIYSKKTTTKMLGDFTVQRVNKEFENF